MVRWLEVDYETFKYYYYKALMRGGRRYGDTIYVKGVPVIKIVLTVCKDVFHHPKACMKYYVNYRFLDYVTALRVDVDGA